MDLLLLVITAVSIIQPTILSLGGEQSHRLIFNHNTDKHRKRAAKEIGGAFIFT